MYPFYFTLGGLIPLGILVYFAVVGESGPITKAIVAVLFVATFFIQGYFAGHAVSSFPSLSEPLIWMVIRIVYAVVLLVWLKKDELNL